MAIFCYRDDEDELTEVSFPIGEAPPTIRVKRGDREVIARRSFQDEMGSVARPGRYREYGRGHQMTEFVAGLQQYGPMAVFCGILLWMNWRNQERMSASLEKRDDDSREGVRAMADLAGEMRSLVDEMRSRPCLSEKAEKKSRVA